MLVTGPVLDFPPAKQESCERDLESPEEKTIIAALKLAGTITYDRPLRSCFGGVFTVFSRIGKNMIEASEQSLMHLRQTLLH